MKVTDYDNKSDYQVRRGKVHLMFSFRLPNSEIDRLAKYLRNQLPYCYLYIETSTRNPNNLTSSVTFNDTQVEIYFRVESTKSYFSQCSERIQTLTKQFYESYIKNSPNDMNEKNQPYSVASNWYNTVNENYRQQWTIETARLGSGTNPILSISDFRSKYMYGCDPIMEVPQPSKPLKGTINLEVEQEYSLQLIETNKNTIEL